MIQVPNVNQLELFRASRDNIDTAFLQFHVENPQVYSALRRLAVTGKSNGRGRLSMKALFEIFRAESYTRTTDPAGFKINNTFTRPYAHLLMEQERCSAECQGCAYASCLAGCFEVRLSPPTAYRHLDEVRY